MQGWWAFLCLALLVLHLFDHLRALIVSSPQARALVLPFALVEAVQLATSGTVDSANIRPLRLFHTGSHHVALPAWFAENMPLSPDICQGKRESSRCKGPVWQAFLILEVLYFHFFFLSKLRLSACWHTGDKIWRCTQEEKSSFTAGIQAVL